MMEKKSKISINLSSSKRVSVGGVFYKWAFQAGRAIVVLIELVALGALGYRFMVDGQIVDVYDNVQREASLVQFQSDYEKTFRSIQERLDSIKVINEETTGKIEIIDDIIDAISASEFTQTDLTINGNTISLSGNALSVFTVENFTNKIQAYPQVNSIIIDEINTSSSGIRFRLRITLVENKLAI